MCPTDWEAPERDTMDVDTQYWFVTLCIAWYKGLRLNDYVREQTWPSKCIYIYFTLLCLKIWNVSSPYMIIFRKPKFCCAIFMLWSSSRKRLRAKLLGPETHIAQVSSSIARKIGKGAVQSLFLYYHRRSLFQIGNDTNTLIVLFQLWHKRYEETSCSIHLNHKMKRPLEKLLCDAHESYCQVCTLFPFKLIKRQMCLLSTSNWLLVMNENMINCSTGGS